MASSGSSGGGGGGGQLSWRSGPLGASGGSGGSDRNDRMPLPLHSPIGHPPVPPPHHQNREKNHETVCNLLSMLTLGVEEDPQQQGPPLSTTSMDNQRMLLINMANSPESCLALRRAGCIPLLIELIHPPQRDNIQTPEIIRVRAAKALKNIVQLNPDEKVKKKELRVLKFLEGIRLFSEAVKGLLRKQQMTPNQKDSQSEGIQHPTSSITTLMKLSFDEEHRHTMCLLGAIHALADLVVSDHQIHGNGGPNLKEDCLLLRRYSGMTLTNLTFNDGTNKALLCGMKEFLNCLVSQLECDNEEICQVTASVFRNLSWHADSTSRSCLRDSSAVAKLMLAAIKAQKEATLKATLSALWNLSAHSAANKSAICTSSTESLPFLISLMRPNNPVMKQMKTPMTIIENAGGILRNISSHVSSTSDLRRTLRDHHCYEILLEHLKSSSLTVVSNACGTLWSLSDGSECEEDQRKLLDLNAIPMLKSLVYSKHERISQGASAALRNLLSSRFAKDRTLHLDSRLTAQIYSPRQGGQEQSPGSDTEYDLGLLGGSNNHYSSHPQVTQPEPPAAHQSSFGSQTNSNSLRSHKVQPTFNTTGSSAGAYRRPNTINYAGTDRDTEPLDLTMTSAKSSPIHVISAAEFSSLHYQRHKGSSSNGSFYHPSQSQSQMTFFNSPNLIHQEQHNSSGGLRKYSFPGAKFNASCPEILSRFQTPTLIAPHNNNEGGGGGVSSKPLDFSSTSASASSSTRGAGEAVLNDSNGNGGPGGDTTFNYSLRFSEDVEEDDEPRKNKSDDTVKTYYCEGTPHNFSISNSCQDLVQELEYEKEQNEAEKAKLQPIDEVPKSYYVENTPAAYSRRSSLSSIHSSNAGENPAEEEDGGNTPPLPQMMKPTPMERASHNHNQQQIQIPPQPLPRKKILNLTQSHSQPHTPCRVTFSAEETPLMFSRCSSVASLESLDVGGGSGVAQKNQNDDELSDYSRRASEVVSPSDIPDSPRALAPPVRMFEQPKPEDLQGKKKKPEEEDDDHVKIWTMEERSGLQSCRSLSPLTVDGEELPIIGRDKLNLNSSSKGSTDTTVEESRQNQNVPQEEETDGGKIFRKPPGDDELKIFAMEGTPFYGISTATSLSDLMADIDDTPMPKFTEEPQRTQNPPEKEQNPQIEPVQNPIPLDKPEDSKEEPIYSDAQLLEKCIRVGKAMGIPKSQSEFRIGNTLPSATKTEGDKSDKMTTSLQGPKPLGKQESKSQDFEFDDPDLAALIQIGRNRTKDNKDKSTSSSGSKGKGNKKTDKVSKPLPMPKLQILSSLNKTSESAEIKPQTNETPAPAPTTEGKMTELQPEAESPQDAIVPNIPQTLPLLESTMSLGSEWNDETPTFSSPIPSMSISTALKLAGSVCDSSLSGKPPLPPPKAEKPTKEKSEAIPSKGNINLMAASMSSINHELLDNIDPPSNFSNLVSSTDFIPQSPARHGQPHSQNSTLSDRLNKKWKALNETGSTHSNLSGQKPPPDFDLENSMISVASIKSEIYELSSASNPQDVFESAAEDVVEFRRPCGGDNSLGGNTYTIFPPENANRLSGVKSTDLSDGGNTVISEDFTDAEDIEEFETAPMQDRQEDDDDDDEPEKSDMEKSLDLDVELTNSISELTGSGGAELKDDNVADSPATAVVEVVTTITTTVPLPTAISPHPKPLMQVHPLVDPQSTKDSSSSKYNTFVVKKSPMISSPRSSPRQKRREDPDRYRTRTINPINMAGRSIMSDANGNPEMKFATFRVNGPKIKQGSPNLNSESDTSVSPGSSPGQSPKGIRGRRKPLYSSLPPSAIIRNNRKITTTIQPPPVPPKPARTASPARSTTSSTSGGVYVRPTRTTELRMGMASNQRENSPLGKSKSTTSSRNSSNSSLNLIHSRYSEGGGGGTPSVTSTASSIRPKVAPKPPVRTTPSISTGQSTPSTSNSIKGSNSTFGFGQQAKIGDIGPINSNMKGYSTLPKSSKLGTGSSSAPFSAERYQSKSRESVAASEKSGKSGIGKITNLWKKMDFRHSKESTTNVTNSRSAPPQPQPQRQEGKKSSKLSNLFGRKKDKAPVPTPGPAPTGPAMTGTGRPPGIHGQKPFRDPLPIHSGPTSDNFAVDSTAPASKGQLWMRRDGDSTKVTTMVPPFNYTPPAGHKATEEQNGNPGSSKITMV